MCKTVKAELFPGKFGVPARAPSDWMLRFSESVRQERNDDDETDRWDKKSNAACKQQTAVMAGKRALVWWSFKIAISSSLVVSGLTSERGFTGLWTIQCWGLTMEPCALMWFYCLPVSPPTSQVVSTGPEPSSPVWGAAPCLRYFPCIKSVLY